MKSFHLSAELGDREFVGGKFTKVSLLIAAKILTKLNFIIKKQYADIRKSDKEENIFATGYIIVAQKK